MWALEREGDNGRLLVFAHDLHLMKGRLPEGTVQRSVGTARLLETGPRLGLHLQSLLGSRYVNIASTYGDGEPTGWMPPATPILAAPAPCGRLDAELNRVGPALFFLDLRQSRSAPEARDWLNRAHERGYDLNVLEAWDAVLFVRHISPVRR
jgi:erythromycin esterase